MSPATSRGRISATVDVVLAVCFCSANSSVASLRVGKRRVRGSRDIRGRGSCIRGMVRLRPCCGRRGSSRRLITRTSMGG